MDATYDVIVLGGGPAGENAADYAVRGGLTAVMVEAELVGGECSYWACMPSKALLRPGSALEAARRVEGAQEAVTGGLDVEAVFARRNSFTSDWKDQGQVEWLAGAKIDLVRGHGRLAGPKVVRVGDTTLTARHAVVVATGTAGWRVPRWCGSARTR
jgi:pyruvate/2-oxoglutarate dehydrogenase complex dihydrolipoamide dehydrogenase (E3) component